MSEYITEWYWDERRNAPNQAQREEIVRCRDCKHYIIVDETYDCDPIFGCGFLYFKGKRIDDDLQEPQEPDGFCAWGERDSWTTCKCGEEIELGNREYAICPSCGRDGEGMTAEKQEPPEIVNSNRPKDGDWYVMECTVKAARIEKSGGCEMTRTAEFYGYATAEVVNTALAMMREVLSQ